VAVGNGSCEILLAAAEALCEPGDELLFAWPSFSIYPHLAALSGAREIRVPLADGYVHDLDAMLVEITAATQLVCVCNPNNPTGTHLPAGRIAEFCERVPSHVTVALDEAYVEFQVDDDPDATVDLLADFPNLVVLRTFSKAYGLAGLRCGYALCGARFRAAVDAVRQPFSVNQLAQVAGSEAILHQDDVAQRVERTIVERVFVEEGVRELGLDPPDSAANFSWIPLGERDEEKLVRSLGRAGVVVRGGAGLGAPGHIRVTYGTRGETSGSCVPSGARCRPACRRRTWSSHGGCWARTPGGRSGFPGTRNAGRMPRGSGTPTSSTRRIRAGPGRPRCAGGRPSWRGSSSTRSTWARRASRCSTSWTRAGIRSSS
jgi:histidinol-phosphate aminotransferase